MKRILIRLLVLLLFHSAIVFAFAADSDQSPSFVQYHCFGNTIPSGESVYSIIIEKYRTSVTDSIDRHIESGLIPSDSHFNLRKFVVAYSSSLESLSKFSVDAEAVQIDEMFCPNPTIYVPIWGTVDNKNRIVGHITYSYNIRDEEYDYSSVSVQNTRYDGFLSGETAHFLDKAGAFESFAPVQEELLDIKIQNAVLIRMPYAVNNYDGNIFLFETDNGYYVCDTKNTAHLPEGEEKFLMSLEEYVSIRAEYEKRFSSASRGTEGLLAGGNSVFNISIGIAAVCVGTILVLLLHRHKKKCRTEDGTKPLKK